MRLLSQRERIRGFFPTEVRLPLWVRPLALEQALAGVRISDVSVRRISSEFRPRLMASIYRPDLPVALNPRDYEETARSEAPVDGREIVEWMHISAIENMDLQARLVEYNMLGSQAVGSATDPYYPGLVVEDCKVRSEAGATIRSRGYGIADTPRGSFNVPLNAKSPGIFSDVITWSSMSAVGGIQWNATLIKWKSLAETPITQSAGFYMDYRGNAAPNFFVQKPPAPRLSVRVRQVFSSDGDQNLVISFRDPTNYSSERGTKSVAIAGGQSEVTYTVSSFPYVPPLICQVQPQDGRQTTIDSYTVT
jgi:hypothetical protein